MANKKYKRRSKTTIKTGSSTAVKRTPWQFPLSKENGMIMLVGVTIIVIGYVLMGTAITDNEAEYLEVWNNTLAVTVAPIMLVIGYCVFIPLGLMWRKRTGTDVRTDG